MVQVREVLRLWLQGRSEREIERITRINRKTVRRYLKAAGEAGLDQKSSEEELTDALLAQICEAIRPGRPQGSGRGETWDLLERNRALIERWLKGGLKLTKIRRLLVRHTGQEVSYRTLHRFCTKALGFRAESTVRLADGEPGFELQVDFGRLGMIFDPDSNRKRVLKAMIFTAVYSRHMFVWLTFTESFDDVIAGFEAAWAFFGGIFKVVIPDYVPRHIIRVLFPATLCTRAGPCRLVRLTPG